ncbi:hypothetical protein [Streptomyces sp. NBC_00199]|uniref:hypothetical protein n=1 Tax=Streptomyces sp. NBC_00199 TaxID=2975678 RepID=UPI00225177FC|nr:hypothetical protein [Streptomyces sp. NBC_00199]MCX5264451.1 hypothetical protein [Streptomyces sp. NBC_00199]
MPSQTAAGLKAVLLPGLGGQEELILHTLPFPTWRRPPMERGGQDTAQVMDVAAPYQALRRGSTVWTGQAAALLPRTAKRGGGLQTSCSVLAFAETKTAEVGMEYNLFGASHLISLRRTSGSQRGAWAKSCSR